MPKNNEVPSGKFPDPALRGKFEGQLGNLIPEFSDAQARDTFIGIALRELIAQQIATKQTGQYEVAAAHAVRYADAVMQARTKAPKVVAVSGGRGVAVTPPPVTEVSDMSKSLGDMDDEKFPPPGEGELPPNIVPPISQRENFEKPLAELK